MIFLYDIRIDNIISFRAKYRQDLSMFVVKNLCYIFLLSHSLYPGMMRMFKECDRKRNKVKDFAKRKLIPHDDQVYWESILDANDSWVFLTCV